MKQKFEKTFVYSLNYTKMAICGQLKVCWRPGQSDSPGILGWGWVRVAGLAGSWGGAGRVAMPMRGGDTDNVCWNMATLCASCNCFL